MQKKLNMLVKILCLTLILVLSWSFIPVNKVSAASGLKTYEGLKYKIVYNKASIESYRGNAVRLIIPDKIKGKKVTWISSDKRGEEALGKVREITIGRYVRLAEILDSHGKEFWKNLSSISVKEGNKEYYSQNGVLFRKIEQRNWLMHYPVKKQTTDGKYSIPEGVEGIDGEAFAGCKYINEIRMPSSLTGYQGFIGCDNLKKIYVSPGNKKFASKSGSLYDKRIKTLIQCPNLLSNQYKFPKSVTAIGNGAFYGNKNLKEITIPKQIKKVESGAFEDCVNLKTIRFEGKLKKISPSLFPQSPIKKLIIMDPGTDLVVHEGDQHDDDDCIPGSGCIKKMFQKGLGRGTIYCKKGSKAEQTALKYNLRMSYIK